MPGPEVCKFYIWLRISLIWEWCFVENPVTDEEPTSALSILLCYDKIQLCTKLVLFSSTYPHLPIVVPGSLLPTDHSVHAESLFSSSALDHLVPDHCLLLSLDQYLRHPRNPSCRILVCRALCQCWRPPWLCPFILRTLSIPLNVISGMAV